MAYSKDDNATETLYDMLVNKQRDRMSAIRDGDDPEAIPLYGTLADRPDLTPFQATVYAAYQDLLPEAFNGFGEGYIPTLSIVGYAQWRGHSRHLTDLMLKGIRAIENGKFEARSELEDQKEKTTKKLQRKSRRGVGESSDAANTAPPRKPNRTSRAGRKRRGRR